MTQADYNSTMMAVTLFVKNMVSEKRIRGENKDGRWVWLVMMGF